MAADYVSMLLADLSTTHYAVAVAVLLGLPGVLYLLCCALRGAKKPQETAEDSGSEEQVNADGGQKQKKQQQAKVKGTKIKPQRKITLPSHPLLAAEFRGHTGSVLSLDFDDNGKYLASCSEDRTIRLWFMKTLQEKEHKYTRKNVDLDHATHIKFSPDGTAVVTCLAGINSLHVFRLLKQKGGNVSIADAGVEFSQASPHSLMIISIGIASTGKFVMTCTETVFTIWTLKGDVLATVETHQSPNTCAGVSPCGKFIACAGFTPDVKLWEVGFSKAGEFQQVSRAMELKGHRASVLSLSFSGDSQRMATVSKDGTWKFWDIDVRYQLQEDPRLLRSASLPEQGPSLVALAPDARVVAVAISTSLFLYSSTSGELMQTLANMHGDTITSLSWEPSSLYLASAGGGDRQIRLWHNAPGLKETVRELRPKIPKASSEPLKRRLQQQVEEAEERLKSLGQL